MTIRRTTSSVVPAFLSLQDAATHTGFSVYTLRAKIHSGELPAYRLSGKPGAELRVKLADLDALLEPYIPSTVYAEQVARQRHPLSRGC